MSTLTKSTEDILSNYSAHYTIHFHDWNTWQEPETGTINFCGTLECPQCFSKLRPVQIISQTSQTWWVVCPQCRAKYQRYIPYQTQPIEADPRDELLILMWSRIQKLEQRVHALENLGRQSPPTRPAQDSLIASSSIDDLPERYRSLLKSK